MNTPSSRRGWIAAALTAVVYLIGAEFGLAIGTAGDVVTPVWPATGVAVAAFVLFGPRRVWVGVAVAAAAINLWHGASLPLALAMSVGNTLAPLFAAELVKRFDMRSSLERLRDVIVLVTLGGMVSMTISASLGTVSLWIFGKAPTLDTWTTWWVGDAFGVILFAPFFLTSFANDRLIRDRWRQATMLLGSLAVATLLAVVTDSPVGYLVVPLAMAAAFQLEQQGAAFAVLIMTVIDITHLGFSEAGSRTLEADLMQMQGVNTTLALILLAMASVMHERRVAQARLRSSATELERRVAERTEALRTSEERLAKAQELAHIGSFQWDAATDTNDWSDELFRIYGLDPEAGPPGFAQYMGFIRADMRDEIQRSIQGALETGEPVNHEYAVTLADGRKKWVQAYIEVIKNEDGSLAGLRGTCQDVTDRKVAEAALRWSEGRFRVLLESAPDAVIVVDPTGKVVLANKQTENILGYDREELLGQPVEILLPDDLRDSHVEHRHTYNAQPEGRPMGAGRDLYAIRKDGTRVAVDISLSPVETDSGFLVFALLRDASERRKVEEALRTALDREREASEDLRKLDRAKNAFLSAVSHELRTPLTAILGFAELLEEDNVRASEEMTTELVGRVRYSASRLNDLLGDLLDLDRLHRGIVEPRRRPTSLRDMVVRALAGMQLGAHPLSLEVDDADVHVDPAQTERIVENLVSNAVKYTPAGTNIYLQVNAAPDGGVVLAVEDEGPGVPKDLWNTIFEPFVRADTGAFTQGTGIGLALVDRFAKLHGGSASVGERPGGGASFHVVLPGLEPVIGRPDHAAVA